ncbi:aminodeoxychorismate synthase component I [Arundinibacter roseus]|uniref:Aminodeoxychorismate synthase component I n=2 Tax=Arundinibacter roseus TaxID=2070510 RepID=A0A4R4K814_9BACT|nr:aminodeoxychorismate synthase component I [Arundinibacter roseus]
MVQLKASAQDSQNTFVSSLNSWGQQKIPFVFIMDYLGQKPQAWRLDEADPAVLCFNFNGFSNDSSADLTLSLPDYFFEAYPLTFEEYKKRFDYVIDNIRRGNSFLVNLSAPTPIATNLSLPDIYQLSHAPFRFWLKDQFVCFSPELFIRIDGKKISSFPMKGTIQADVPNAPELILADAKEAAEHATIVDLIRNDLSMVAQKVWVERYRYLDRIQTNQNALWQVSSEVAGLLPDEFDGTFGDILLQLLPAGSISGAPKPSTMKIISEAEGYERGYYTGIMGYFDGTVFESAVMIRYIEQQPGGLIFKSGGGITAQSRVEPEYQELLDKVYLPFSYAPSPALHRDYLCKKSPMV